MADKVEYNRVALSDVSVKLAHILEKDNQQISAETINMGQCRDKMSEIFETYNTIGNGIVALVQQTKTMVDDVINRVDEVEGS